MRNFEPIVIINGVSTKSMSTISYTGSIFLDVELFKCKIADKIISSFNIDKYIFWQIMNTIQFDVYRTVLTSDPDTLPPYIQAMANIIVWQCGIFGIYLDINSIIQVICENINNKMTYNHK